MCVKHACLRRCTLHVRSKYRDSACFANLLRGAPKCTLLALNIQALTRDHEPLIFLV